MYMSSTLYFKQHYFKKLASTIAQIEQLVLYVPQKLFIERACMIHSFINDVKDVLTPTSLILPLHPTQ